MWPYLFLLCVHSVQVVSTLLVLICTDNFSVKIYWRSLTDEQILAALRDLKGDYSRDNLTKSDNDNYENCVSLVRQESNVWNVWSFCKDGTPQQTMTAAIPLKMFTKKFFLLKVLIEIYYKVMANYLNIVSCYINTHKTEKHVKKHAWVILTHSAVLGNSNSPRF